MQVIFGPIEKTYGSSEAIRSCGRQVPRPCVRLALHPSPVERKLDGAFVVGPIERPEIQQETLCIEELVLATNPAIRSLEVLAKIRDLRTIVFRAGCSYCQRLETLLARFGVIIAKPSEFGSLDVIVNCVAAGGGIALLPKGDVASAAALGSVAIHSIPGDLGHVETLFIRRHDGYVSSAMAAFLDIARLTQV